MFCLITRSTSVMPQVRVESMKSDDKVRARQRFRICVTTQRMMCCIMLCKVAEQLISKHGYNGAEKELKQHPDTWLAMLQKQQMLKNWKIQGLIVQTERGRYRKVQLDVS
jgi:hypothetical protein